MKRFSLFLISFLSALLLSAEERSVQQAGVIAKEFMASMPSTKSAAMDLQMVWDGTAAVKSGDEAPAFYVFDNVSGPGFVIVSGDDKARTILGYSLDNELDADNLPPHFISWMREISDQVEYMRSRPAYAGTKADTDVGTTVLKHETAKWNQGAPYNIFCPMDGQKQSVTGCVATATAIVMRFHKWPDAGVGTTPAYTI